MAKSKSLGIGLGHHGNSNLPVIREAGTHPQFELMVKTGMLQRGSRRYRMGGVQMIVSPPENGQWWHMSISHPNRYPTWDEVAKAWYELVPDADQREGVMKLPKKEAYVNLHDFCFQITEVV